MTLPAAIYAHLAANAGVAALVSTRIYPVGAPEPAMGAVFPDSIVFLRLSWERDRDLSNAAEDKQRFEIDCMSETADTAEQIMIAVIAALDNYRGTLGGVGGVAVKQCNLSDARDSVLADQLERGVFVAVAEFEFFT